MSYDDDLERARKRAKRREEDDSKGLIWFSLKSLGVVLVGILLVILAVYLMAKR